jgi:hypothetical protein
MGFLHNISPIQSDGDARDENTSGSKQEGNDGREDYESDTYPYSLGYECRNERERNGTNEEKNNIARMFDTGDANV